MALLKRKPKTTKKEAPAAKLESALITGVINRPVVTEKTSSLQSSGKYVFEIADNANKVTVARAFASLYGVTPSKVAVMVVRGKSTRFGRTLGHRQTWKKAIVTLPKGKSVDVFKA